MDNIEAELRTISCRNCSKVVKLESSWENTCLCGAMYNGSGQALAPHEHWGEETNEHPADLARFNPDNLNDDDFERLFNEW
jgi:hypothetical protein